MPEADPSTGTGGEGGNAETTTETGSTGTGETSTGTFSQDDLTRVGTKEFKRGRQDAAKAAAEELGMSVEEAKKILAANTAREEAEATELDRARKAQADAEALAAQAAATANQAVLRNALLEALTTGDGKDVHPVQPGYRDAALDLALIQASRSETEDVNELAAEAVEHVRKTATVFFTAGTGGTNGPGTGSPAAPVKTGAQTGSTQSDAATEAQRMLDAHKPKPITLPAFGGKPSSESSQ